MAGSFAAALLHTGCVSNKYADAKKDTPPAHLLNAAFAPSPLEAVLDSVITYNGPGSWKRDALWDEYVVTFHNPGNQPLSVSAAGLVDPAGAAQSPGGEPWTLEKDSKRLEQKYREAGLTFSRESDFDKLKLGTGLGIIVAGLGAGGAVATAGAMVFWAPVYFWASSARNHDHRALIEAEFTRRRIVMPLTLAPGETRTGSFYFPMTPRPRSLGLHWSAEQQAGETVLPLDFLRGLHDRATPPSSTAK